MGGVYVVIHMSKVELYANETLKLFGNYQGEWGMVGCYVFSPWQWNICFLVPHICSFSQFWSQSVILALLQQEWSVWFIWNKTVPLFLWIYFNTFKCLTLSSSQRKSCGHRFRLILMLQAVTLCTSAFYTQALPSSVFIFSVWSVVMGHFEHVLALAWMDIIASILASCYK